MITLAALPFIRRAGKTVLVLFLLLSLLSLCFAQDKIQQPLAADGDNPSDRALSTMEAEMRAKRAIKEAEKEYQENLERARDLSSLGTTVVASFKQKRELDEHDYKKLEKVEKLAKGIRRAAGGCEDDVEMEKPPRDLISAMEMLDVVSHSLKSKVEKTPKHVISAAVIDEANVLLELLRILRTLPPKV